MSCCCAQAAAGSSASKILSADFKRLGFTDAAREVEHRARKSDAVLHGAHDRLGGKHPDAEGADALDERQVLAIDDKAVDEAQVLGRHRARRRLLAELAHHLAGGALER